MHTSSINASKLIQNNAVRYHGYSNSMCHCLIY